MINFPSNPTTGDVYSFQGRIWRWNGVSWRTIASSYSGNIIIIGGSSGNVVSVNGQTGVVTLSTANITEQGNLYFTNARVYANIIGLGYATNTYVNTRLDTKANITDLTTSNVVEGSNLYFTNTRAISAFTSGSGISIASNGRITSTATGGGGNVDSINGLTGVVVLTTANVFEDGNLYFTNTRVYSNIIALGYATNTYINTRLLTKANTTDLTTSNIVEGSNLYFTNTRAISAFASGSGISIASNGRITSTVTGGGNVDSVNGLTGTILLTTANISEQSNLYFTNTRVYANVIELGYATNSYVNSRLLSKANVSDLTSENVVELTNLYFTNARVYDNVITLGYATNAYVNTGLLTKANTTDLTTSNIVENGNLYFTNTRAISALTPGTGIVIESNGRISGTAVSGVSSVNGVSGDVQLFYYSNTAPNINTSGAIWYKGDDGNVFIFISDGTSNEWIEIDQGGILSGVTSVNGLTGTILLTTANISEQSNLYFTNGRVYANVIELGYATNTYVNSRLLSKANVSDLTTANISELTNLYYTNARVYDNVITLGYATNAYVNTRLETKANVGDLTTSNIVEGSNLYYTNARVYANVILLDYANTNTTNTISNNLAIAWNTANSAFNKANTSFTVNGTSIFLGNTVTITSNSETLTGTSLNSTILNSNLNSVGILSTLQVANSITIGDSILGSGSNGGLFPLGVTNIVIGSPGGNTNIRNNLILGSGQTLSTSGTVTANAVTAFKAGDAAISGVALEIPREGGIRNLFNGDNTMYFDVSIGGSSNGSFRFRGTSSYTEYLNISVDGLRSLTAYKGKTSYNVALDTEVTVDNLKFRISNQGGIFPQVGNASGTSVDICWSSMAVVSGGAVSSQNTGIIITAGSWTSIYTAHGLDTRGDTIVAHITDKNASRIYRVTYLVTNNSSNTTGYNILVERII